MKNYELVFLDADDTIFDYKTSERYSLKKALEQSKIILTEEIANKYSQINKKLWLEYEKNNITQEILRIERFRLLFKDLMIEINEKEFSLLYLKYLSESSFIISGADEICKYLHKNYKIALLTNGISVVQRNRLDHSVIKKYIDYCIISEEAKYSKPDIGIFTYAETITKCCNKEKMIIIGDSLTSDMLGGINYGIDTCWYNSENKINGTNIKPKFEINKLSEIFELL